jgi:KaiC/GvpD/RAD55 family RecA-like ATPase
MATDLRLTFGINELDELIKSPDGGGQPGILVDRRKSNENSESKGPFEGTSICLLGPDGTGKSILALHLACHYLAENVVSTPQPRVVYFSTDLSHARAYNTWKAFGLIDPKARWDKLPKFAKGLNKPPSTQIILERYDPLDGKKLAEYLHKPLGGKAKGTQEVAFIDAEASTTGDDWLYLQRLVSLLPEVSKAEPPHMLIVDAVEGLEPVAGGPDTFGDTRMGRSRIAQLIRSAKKKCHIVYIVEEPKSDERLDTQYVTDVVIRLRSSAQTNYSRRTIEIEKARSHIHVRGQHDIAIRSGKGTTTGDQFNPDDPCVPINCDTGESSLAYIHILRSLHSLSRELLEHEGHNPDVNPDRSEVFGFGIRYLDRLLPRVVDKKNMGDDKLKQFNESIDLLKGNYKPQTDTNTNNKRGLIGGTVNALIGPLTTHKSSLARAFLAQALEPVTRKLKSEVLKVYNSMYKKIKEIDASNDEEKEKKKKDIEQEYEGKIQSALQFPLGHGGGIAVLFTTQPMDGDVLIKEMLSHLGFPTDAIDRLKKAGVEEKEKRKTPDNKKREEGEKNAGTANADIREVELNREDNKKSEWKWEQTWNRLKYERVICRRLEVHHLSSPGAVHLASSVLRQAQFLLLEEEPYQKDIINQRATDPSRLACRRIRVVIDDWHTVRVTYPEAAADNLVLPFLTQMFRREGVTTLFVETEPGLPLSPALDADTQLRTQTSRHVYTWLVPFAGERRVALTAVPPAAADLPATVYELRPARAYPGKPRDLNFHDERLVVDPHFEMYSGLETGQIERVPLRVKLYLGNRSATKTSENDYFHGIKCLFAELFRGRHGEDVVMGVNTTGYDLMRDNAFLQDGIRLDHTSVMQVDEFWSESHPSLYDLTEFMKTEVIDSSDDTAQIIEDAHKLYQGSERNGKRRMDQFSISTRNHCNDYKMYVENDFTIDKVPYLWDFGFLLARRDDWLAAKNQEVILQKNDGRTLRTYIVTVKDIWNALTPFDLDTGDPFTSREQTIQAEAKKTTTEIPNRSPTGSVWAVPITGTDPKEGTGEERTGEEGPGEWVRIGWQDLFQVCKQIRRGGGDYIFDVDLRTVEVLSCLLFEVWFSLSFERIKLQDKDSDINKKLEKVLPRHRHDKMEKVIDLTEFLNDELFQQELYLAIGLIFQHIGGLETESGNFVPRVASKGAVCARHFYSTACDPLFNDGSLVPLRLPGLLSARGDWFMALAAGSRSIKLGERAIDLLSSRRANLTRLQEGIGLPVRLLVSEDDFKLRTALQTPWRQNMTPNLQPDKIYYGDLLKLCPKSVKTEQSQDKQVQTEPLFMITDKSLLGLQNDKVKEELSKLKSSEDKEKALKEIRTAIDVVLSKLKPLKDNKMIWSDFRKVIKDLLTPDELKLWKGYIFNNVHIEQFRMEALFSLTDNSFSRLENDNAPEPVRTKLIILKDEKIPWTTFRKAIKDVLATDEYKKWKNHIFKHADQDRCPLVVALDDPRLRLALANLASLASPHL